VLPASKLKDNRLVYFVVFKNPAFKKELSPYEGHNGNLKFPFVKPIPPDLVKRIVKHRAKEISEEMI